MKIKKVWTVEQRFPTKLAREAADLAVDRLPISETMATHLDVWLEVYFSNNGIDKLQNLHLLWRKAQAGLTDTPEE